MKESADELLHQRVHRLKTAISLNEPDRIPIFFQTLSWIPHYSGLTVQETSFDYGSLIRAIEKVIQDFEWDGIWSPGGIWPAPVFIALGQTQYLVPGESLDARSSFQFPDVSCMEPDEYPEFIADPYAFIVEKIMPRRCTELTKPFPRNAISLAKGALEFGRYLTLMDAAYERWRQVYGMPVLTKGLTGAPLDILADFYRGIRGLLIDIKRRPEQVKEACEALLPLQIKFAKVSYGEPKTDFPPIMLPIHIATFLRPSDFAEFFWPTFYKLVIAIVEMGLTCLLMLEGTWDPYLDYLAQLPKGKFLGLMQHVDMKRAKAVLGNNMCIAGNIPCSLLGHRTQEEVLAYAKKLIDTCAPGGGYIFAADSTLLSLNDAKPENLLAVTKFVKEYGGYRK